MQAIYIDKEFKIAKEIQLCIRNSGAIFPEAIILKF